MRCITIIADDVRVQVAALLCCGIDELFDTGEAWIKSIHAADDFVLAWTW